MKAKAQRFAGLVVGSVAVILAGACHRAGAGSPAVMIKVEIAPEPVTVGLSTVTVSVMDAQSAAVTHARLTVEGDMSHPGMSPVFADASEIGDGRYRAQVQFAMAGDWVLLLHLKLPDGQVVERQVDVKGVRAQ